MTLPKKKTTFTESDYEIESKDLDNFSETKNDSKIDDFEVVKSTRASGVLNFKIPKEMEEKLKRVNDDKNLKNEKITKILVEDSAGKKEITSEELKEYISKNKKINKITIEEVKANDVKRMNLHFDKEKNSRFSETSQEIDPLMIEKNINKSFLKKRDKVKLKDEFAEVVELLGNDTTKVKVKKKKQSLFDEFEELKGFSEVSGSHCEDIAESPVAKLSLADEEGKQFKNQESVKKAVTLDIAKHELRRKNSKSLSKLYYKAVNHIELFKLGDTYLQDYNRGIKNIAFNSLDSTSDREKTVLGISSFLNYNARITVTVVTDEFEKSLYKELIPDLEETTKSLGFDDITYNCLTINGIEIVDYAELWNAITQVKDSHLEELIEAFTELADIILWDLPFLSKMDAKKELFYPIIRYLDNVSLIVKSNISKYKELDSVKDYFEKYQVPIKGLVLAD
ncbi:MAG: hypothetical protein VX341_01945 [Bdellovibrionota bacterium]|nr:hypothetical protein [Bdellovibrionota bacterium]